MAYLKIKDDVDLKELERFGFFLRDTSSLGGSRVYYEFFDEEYENSIDIDIDNRIIDTMVMDFCESMYHLYAVVYDLIQAGLVEKVEYCNE